MEMWGDAEMERSMFLSGSKPFLSEIGIILLGSEEGGKTSAGNTILGREAFELKKSAECIKKHGVVARRRITVIDTPGRKKGYLASTTPKLYKEEVVRSVALAPPGPHALLLVIKINCPFIAECKQAVEEHLQLFGENVWNHIIVLFTHGDKLEEDITIQQHIQDEGEPLQELLQKCGNRYHVFNNMEREDRSQVNELLEKIEDMVVENKGHHFEMDKHVLQGLLEKKKEQGEKAKERRMLMLRPKENLRSTTDLKMVLLGHQCSGKSSVGDTILRGDMFGIKTVTTSVCKTSTVAGREVTVIDTPGWLKDGLLTDTPKKSKYEIVRSVSMCAPAGPHAFLLVISVDTTFTGSDEKSIMDHLELFGDQVWSHVIVVFSHADWMGDTAIELYIESEGKALQRLVEKCGNRYHALNNMTMCIQTQVRELLEKIEHIGGNHFEMEGNIIDKLKHESLQEEVECKGKNQRSGTHLTLSSKSSGYYSSLPPSPPLSMKSSNSMNHPQNF